MVSAVLFITFFVLLVLNVPIAVCLGLSSAAAILYSGTSLTIVATNIYSGISKFLLLAIPFFVWSAAATEECVWETLAGILSAGAVSSTKDGDGSQSFRQASRTRRRR